MTTIAIQNQTSVKDQGRKGICYGVAAATHVRNATELYHLN